MRGKKEKREEDRVSKREGYRKTKKKSEARRKEERQTKSHSSPEAVKGYVCMLCKKGGYRGGTVGGVR